ncbi:MAG: helix-turn-helix domain-containing protein, partial [Bradymonadia bacterium]
MTRLYDAPDGLSPGEVLRGLRQDRELDIKQLAELTCVNEHVIECLENDDWLALPAMVYVRGYVRILCRELDGDPRDILRRLEDQVSTLSKSVDVQVAPKNSTWRGRSTLAAAVVVATLLIGLLTNMILSPVANGDTDSEQKSRERGASEQ